MENKTCGECKHFEPDDISACCEAVKIICNDKAPACKDFEPKPKPTNGDVIRQMSNRELAKFMFSIEGRVCDYCERKRYTDCSELDNEACFDNIEAWLNSPAESEWKNARNHALLSVL